MPRSSINRVVAHPVVAQTWRFHPHHKRDPREPYAGAVNAFRRMHAEHLPIIVANWRAALIGSS